MVLPFASPIPFSLGFPEPEGHLYFNPPGPVLLQVLVRNEQPAGPPRGNSRAGFTRSLTYPVCPENEIRATPIGIVDTLGGFAGLVLLLSKCLVNRDSETDWVFLGEGISFVDRESLAWAKLEHPCRVLSFESRARGYVADGNLLISGCRELDT